ncbi:MAG: hypothetical protein FWE31_01635 [Firmicutes bacterium]|nr:hypothetical protein [Bacillota bacterium]
MAVDTLASEMLNLFMENRDNAVEIIEEESHQEPNLWGYQPVTDPNHPGWLYGGAVIGMGASVTAGLAAYTGLDGLAGELGGFLGLMPGIPISGGLGVFLGQKFAELINKNAYRKLAREEKKVREELVEAAIAHGVKHGDVEGKVKSLVDRFCDEAFAMMRSRKMPELYADQTRKQRNVAKIDRRGILDGIKEDNFEFIDLRENGRKH